MIQRGFQYVFTCGTCRNGFAMLRWQASYKQRDDSVRSQRHSLWPLPLVPPLCQVPQLITPCLCASSDSPTSDIPKRLSWGSRFVGEWVLQYLKGSDFFLTKEPALGMPFRFRAHFRVYSQCLINANWPTRKPSASLIYCCDIINYKIWSMVEHRNFGLLGASL